MIRLNNLDGNEVFVNSSNICSVVARGNHYTQMLAVRHTLEVRETPDEIAAMLRKQQRLEIASRIAAGMCAAPLDGEDWDPDNIVDVSIDMAERLIKQNEEVK